MLAWAGCRAGLGGWSSAQHHTANLTELTELGYNVNDSVVCVRVSSARCSSGTVRVGRLRATCVQENFLATASWPATALHARDLLSTDGAAVLVVESINTLRNKPLALPCPTHRGPVPHPQSLALKWDDHSGALWPD